MTAPLISSPRSAAGAARPDSAAVASRLDSAAVASRAGTVAGAARLDTAFTVVPFTCDDVWEHAFLAYDSTLLHDFSYAPAKDSYAAQIKQAGGFACAYTSTRNCNRITLAVAKGAPGAFAMQEEAIAASGRRVTKFGRSTHVRIYKMRGRGHRPGDYEIFTGDYWVSITSNLFHTPDAASILIHATLEEIHRS